MVLLHLPSITGTLIDAFLSTLQEVLLHPLTLHEHAIDMVVINTSLREHILEDLSHHHLLLHHVLILPSFILLCLIRLDSLC